jgi:hypothetical protein
MSAGGFPGHHDREFPGRLPEPTDDGITNTTVTDDGNQQERQTKKEQSIDE